MKLNFNINFLSFVFPQCLILCCHINGRKIVNCDPICMKFDFLESSYLALSNSAKTWVFNFLAKCPLLVEPLTYLYHLYRFSRESFTPVLQKKKFECCPVLSYYRTGRDNEVSQSPTGGSAHLRIVLILSILVDYVSQSHKVSFWSQDTHAWWLRFFICSEITSLYIQTRC